MSSYLKINYGKRTFNIEIRRSERKRLTLSVYPDLKIIAETPLHYSDESIQNRLNKKAPWIARQLDFFDQFHPQQPPRKYVSGETHYYLGRQYRLLIKETDQRKVRLKGKFFIVDTADKEDTDTVRNQMQNWFGKHARNYLDHRLKLHLPAFLRLGAPEPEVRYLRMQKRWGSCSKNSKIVLNTELVKASPASIDYVIIHELCHLLFPKHDMKFSRLLNRMMPDWERHKDRLERVVL